MPEESLGLSTDDLLIGLGDSTSFGTLKKQMKQLDKVAVVEEVPTAVLARAERKQNYEATVDILTKVNRQVSFNRRAQQVDFVHEEVESKGATLTPSVSALASNFKARTQLELEMKQAMDLSRPKLSEELNDFTDPKIKQANDQRQFSRLRTLMHAELERNKRIKKIKSRTYRKVRRKAENQEKEKLLTRLETENPELAQKIRDDFERKLAKLRLQRHKQARVKWARVAQRFGGKDTQKEVARQAQDENDEKRELIRAVKGKRKRADSSDLEDDSDEDSDVSDDPVQGAVGELSRVLAEPEDQLPTEGIMSMSFMKKGMQRKRQEALDEARALMGDLQGGAQPAESAAQVDELDEAAVAKASEEIKHLVNLQTFDIQPTPYNPWTQPEAPKAKKAKTRKSQVVEDEVIEKDEVDDAEEESLFNKFGGSELDDSQKQLIKQLFASSDTHEKVFAAESKSVSHEKPETEALAGWGRWAGPGVTKRSKRGGKNTPKAVQKIAKPVPQRMIVSSKVSDDKYSVKAVPYPFTNTEEYSAVQSALTAPELMSAAAHAKTIAPRINVRVGAVIAPLDTSKRLSSKERDVLLDAWNNRRKPSRTRAKF